MTAKYEASENCALELKFAKQCGVPIVPAMMQPGWTASGWLGLLTAGALWTPMHDESKLEENVDGLMRQIMLAIAPDDDEQEQQAASTDSLLENEAASAFTVQEMREELDRLKGADQVISCVRPVC
eukprot:COSAG01_NODE_12427_length_1741_cov_2.351401_1_plen_126_part_00